MAGRPWDIDASEVAHRASKRPFDVVIVGGGSSGLTSAIPLHRAGLRIAILEAGPAPFLTHIANTDLRFARNLSRSLRNVTRYAPALAGGGTFGSNYGCLGGRGLFWNGAAPRYIADDFSGWAVNARDLDAEYQWAESEFRVSTVMGKTPIARRIIEGLKSVGFAAESGPFAADIEDLYTGRLSAGIASGLGPFIRHCGDAVDADELTVAVKTRAAQLIIENNAAQGIVAIGSDGKQFEVPARAVILAGGGIESVKVAAISDVPDPHERIGKGLQEHLFYHALLNAEELYDREKRDSGVVYVPAGSQDLHQWEIHIPGNRLFAIDDGTDWRPDSSPSYQLMIRAFAATEKRDENYIEAKSGELGSSIVHFSHSALDEAKKQAIITDAVKISNALGGQAGADSEINSIDRFRAPGSSYHEAGGLDMGVDPTKSVTAPNGRFHSVSNLFCNDAAAFPRIGAANPHLTIVAVAYRKACALARELKS